VISPREAEDTNGSSCDNRNVDIGIVDTSEDALTWFDASRQTTPRGTADLDLR
jgi:hypothetical protein